MTQDLMAAHGDVGILRQRLMDAQLASSDTEAALDTITGVYMEAANQIDELKRVQADAKIAIGEIFAETGQTAAETSAAKISVGRPSVRVSYDRKSLDALCASDDTVARLLEPHRKETQVPGSLTIRGKK